MSENQFIFKRHEKKYLISTDDYNTLIQLAAGHLALGEFGRGQVFSLYYDTPQYSIIEASLEKPYYKEKVRLRSYGPAHQGDAVFIELKKKLNGVVYKRRVACSYAAALAYMNGTAFTEAVNAFPLADAAMHRQALSFGAQQTVRELDMFKQRNPNLKASMFIGVDRISAIDVDQADLRITFDLNPVWRSTDLTLNTPLKGNALMPTGQMIMEIKCCSAYPLWLVDALNAIEARPQSCSKYGRAYVQYMNEREAGAQRRVPLRTAKRTNRSRNLDATVAAFASYSTPNLKEIPCV